MELLARIKRLAVARQIEFTQKAEEERIADQLMVGDIIESIVNANAIKKKIRSRLVQRLHHHEYLYVIESPNYAGLWIYTKGTVRRRKGKEVFYVFISSKLSRLE